MCSSGTGTGPTLSGFDDGAPQSQSRKPKPFWFLLHPRGFTPHSTTPTAIPPSLQPTSVTTSSCSARTAAPATRTSAASALWASRESCASSHGAKLTKRTVMVPPARGLPSAPSSSACWACSCVAGLTSEASRKEPSRGTAPRVRGVQGNGGSPHQLLCLPSR